jgi:hypothetical protein
MVEKGLKRPKKVGSVPKSPSRTRAFLYVLESCGKEEAMLHGRLNFICLFLLRALPFSQHSSFLKMA